MRSYKKILVATVFSSLVLSSYAYAESAPAQNAQPGQIAPVGQEQTVPAGSFCVGNQCSNPGNDIKNGHPNEGPYSFFNPRHPDRVREGIYPLGFQVAQGCACGGGSGDHSNGGDGGGMGAYNTKSSFGYNGNPGDNPCACGPASNGLGGNANQVGGEAESVGGGYANPF